MSASAPVAAKQPLISAPRSRHAPISRPRLKTILCLLLAVVTLAFYNPIVNNKFTNFDDNGYVTENPHVRAGLTWETVKWSFTSREYSNWHPVTWLSHTLDYELFGLNPVGHHYVNLLLHVCNVVLLFFLLESATGFIWPSAMVAALFALHPVNVESVAWTSERKNILSMFFFLLTLRAYGWYARRISIGRYLAAAALFILGLMSKPEIVTLPFVLLLWDYWPLGRMFPDISEVESTARPRLLTFFVLEKVPLLFLSAASCVITIVAQKNGQAVHTASAWVRWGNAAVAYVRYIGKALWPSNLAALYPHPGRLPAWQVVVSALLLLLITALVLRFRNHRYLPVGWFWFLGTLVPVIGIMQVGMQAMADRYAYIPYIGIFICVAFGCEQWAREKSIAKAWLWTPAILILLTLGAITRKQVGYWHDSETLWRHTLSITTKNFFAHDALGYTLAQQGRMDEAIAEFNQAEALAPFTAVHLIEVAKLEQAHGRIAEARQQYWRAVAASKDSASRSTALEMLGSLFMQIGDSARAKASYQYALQENPHNSAAMIGNGLLAERAGDLAAAVGQISQGVQSSPSDVGYLLLAQAYRRADRVAEANDAEERAAQISSDLPQAKRSADQWLALAGIGAP